MCIRDSYDVGEIRPVVQSMRDENPKAEAIIIGDRNAEVGVVMEVQEMMQDLNIPTIVSTE